jgi:hypothetical protein
MGHINATTVVNRFKRTFGEETLNELGKLSRFCRRERTVTPHRLALSLIEMFASGPVKYIADLQRGFNALCASNVQYKPFHNQLAKRSFATFMRLLLSRLLNDLACKVLRFDSGSPFARFEQICLQDGTSFAVKRTLAEDFPGRFTTVSPAAVELHVNLELLSEGLNTIVLSPDSMAERQFLPPVEALTGCLLLGDRGYFGKKYLCALDAAGGAFIVRGPATMNPLIRRAWGPDGVEIKHFRNKHLKDVAGKLSRYAAVDMDVCYRIGARDFPCRLVAHPNPREDIPRYLVTNLDRESFTIAHVSDGYRLRWQVELLFKEWKSFANLHAFDTNNPHLAEGLIWAALCAATLKRYCAHMTQHLLQVAISTPVVASCIRYVLTDIVLALLHNPGKLNHAVVHALDYLSKNARRAHPKRDRLSGRLKLGLEHVYGAS